MATAATSSFEELVIEVEFDPSGSPGTYTKICGMVDYTISRSNNIDTAEVPDCSDESLPHEIERSVRSREMTISGTGVWARSSHQKMLDWFAATDGLNVRITYQDITANGAASDTETETGVAILASMETARTKGQKVTSSIELQFDGMPTPELKGP